MFCSAQLLHPVSHGERQQGDTSRRPPQAAAMHAPLAMPKTHLLTYTLCSNYAANHKLLCASRPELLLLLELAQLRTRLLSKPTALG